MKNKLIIVSSALLVIIFGLLSIRTTNIFNAPPNSSPSPAPMQETIENTVVVTIDYGNEKSLTKEYPLSENDTAFSVLEKITLDNQISLETKSYDFGIFVESIDGLESSEKTAWIYFVNGESGQVAADEHKLNPGDIVGWKYIEPEY